MKHLDFVRHGESESNVLEVWDGSSDTPLTEKGRSQARTAGLEARKSGKKYDLIISSPLKRTKETAEIIAKEIGYPTEDIIFDSSTIERSFGSIDGKKDIIKNTNYDEDESSIDTYNGVEAFSGLQQRANIFCTYLKSLNQDNILVVGHGAFGRALKRSFCKKALTVKEFRLSNCELQQFFPTTD